MMDDHFFTESLEEFQREMAAAGFEPVAAADPPRWRGPIHPAFAPLTDAKTMDIVITPGWHFQPPALLVDGLDTNHSMLNGLVCMWQDGDASLEWTTMPGFFSRIADWCENARNGWAGDDLVYDAFLNFQKKLAGVATFNLPELNMRKGGCGDVYGIVNADLQRIDVKRGRSNSPGQLRGLWFHAGVLDNPPPRRLSEVFRCLPRNQRKGLERELGNRRRPEPCSVSGGVDIILFCWEHRGRPDLLVMVCEGMNDQVDAVALQPGPIDEDSLILRAGPDAPLLRTCKVTLFGAGALGGYVGVALAESGLGSLDVVDGDTLLPGNVVRHVAGHDQVGRPKAQAVRYVIEKHAPWTGVAEFFESPVTASKIRERIANADMVVDATGNEAFTGALAVAARGIGIPLVSGALYRGGSIARVQRQALPDDVPLHRREDTPQFPAIPAGDGRYDFASPALGCSAPVNNAPPASVTACAALIVQMTLDALTGRFEFNDEVIDVYRSIAEAPFNRVGRVG